MPEIKPLSPEIKKRVLQMQQNELTEYIFIPRSQALSKTREQGDAAENSQGGAPPLPDLGDFY